MPELMLQKIEKKYQCRIILATKLRSTVYFVYAYTDLMRYVHLPKQAPPKSITEEGWQGWDISQFLSMVRNGSSVAYDVIHGGELVYEDVVCPEYIEPLGFCRKRLIFGYTRRAQSLHYKERYEECVELLCKAQMLLRSDKPVCKADLNLAPAQCDLDWIMATIKACREETIDMEPVPAPSAQVCDDAMRAIVKFVTSL